MKTLSRDEFITDRVMGWMKLDIERMMSEIPTKNGVSGQINFPLCHIVLTYIEALGTFLLGHDPGPQHYDDSAGKYIEECFDFPDHYNPKIMGRIFRNGLSHEYFPRGSVSRTGSGLPLVNDDLFGINLDAEVLARDFLKSLNVFSKKLTSECYLSRMKQLVEKAKKEFKELKHEISQTPNVTNLRSYTARLSGASGTAFPIKINSDIENLS